MSVVTPPDSSAEANTSPGAPQIEVYATGICPWCMHAQSLLGHLGLDYTLIWVDEEPGKRAEMERRSGRSSVPQIFINEVHVGGYDDLAALHNAGGLDQWLDPDPSR